MHSCSYCVLYILVIVFTICAFDIALEHVAFHAAPASGGGTTLFVLLVCVCFLLVLSIV